MPSSTVNYVNMILDSIDSPVEQTHLDNQNFEQPGTSIAAQLPACYSVHNAGAEQPQRHQQRQPNPVVDQQSQPNPVVGQQPGLYNNKKQKKHATTEVIERNTEAVAQVEEKKIKDSIHYQGRDILDLASNITPLQFQMQTHTLHSDTYNNARHYSHETPYVFFENPPMYRCEECGFRQPIPCETESDNYSLLQLDYLLASTMCHSSR